MPALLRYIIAIFTLYWTGYVFAEEKILNLFTWAGEIPPAIIQQFEKETGIKVRYDTFNTNEAMFTKLRASKKGSFDLVEPSSFYIDRMRRQGLLLKLDKSKLSNLNHIDPFFLNQSYDPHSDYSIPFIWGATGIFVNKEYFPLQSINRWADLFSPKYKNQLMLLDDSREVFSMVMHLSGFSINDTNPNHIKMAFLKLKELLPNVRLFNSDAVSSILIDEDATVGMVWNGILYRSQTENSKLNFIYPADGFEIWVDNFAILKDSPHINNAYQFLNFIMRPEISKTVSLTINYSTANLSAQKLMPLDVQHNPVLYPPPEILHRGEFQSDVGDNTMALYEKFWSQLKMGV